MYQSTTFAGQKSKSVFVEIPERSAETARLLQQAGDAQREQPGNETWSLRRWAASRWDHLLQRLAAAVAPRRDVAHS
ncbi:MAG: hypothetical protein PVH50_13010 [Anaerolineae bacterium]|jgi:hypothetical protein